MLFNEKILQAAKLAENGLSEVFTEIDRISLNNTEKVLQAFWDNKISDAMLSGTTGYGYDDRGRDALDSIYAQSFGCEDALVRHNFVSGTHVLATALYAVLRPGDVMLSVTGLPYDTLLQTIGIEGADGNGSLKDYGIIYKQIDLLPNGKPDMDRIKVELQNDNRIKLVFIQRSRGYTLRPTLTLLDTENVCKAVKLYSKAYTLVDNCYGEFVCEKEPTDVGADLIAGSLIKNPGGGLAQTGGYIAGNADLVKKAAYRLTAVGIGKECGATLNQARLMFQGFFFAPHVTAQALKTAVFAAKLFENAGFEVSPSPYDIRGDIIQTITCGNRDTLLDFCRGIQAGAPIDSFVTPEPWDMPGYSHQVVMAAGAFVQGASIEISADAPMKPPYTAYLQGGLTYESGKIALMKALSLIQK